MTQPRAYHKRLQRARQKRAQQAKQRRLQHQRERLQREQARAQRVLQALERAVQELELPETVAEEVQWRLQAQQKLMGKIFGMMFPPSVRLSQLSRTVSGAGLG
jgi:3-hydroxyacyl-CoA dehydrogenase